MRYVAESNPYHRYKINNNNGKLTSGMMTHSTKKGDRSAVTNWNKLRKMSPEMTKTAINASTDPRTRGGEESIS